MCFLLIYSQFFFKSWVTPTILISSCFKMLPLGILRLRNTYILLLDWCIYSVQPFIRFCFNTFVEVNIHFVLFKFVLSCCEKPWRFIGLYGDPLTGTLWGYLEQKNLNLVIKPLVREVSYNRSTGWGRGREAEDCSFSVFSFSACIIFYFSFKNQNDGCDKQQNIFCKLEDLMLKIFRRTRALAWSWWLWENKPNIWNLDRAWLWTFNWE